MHADVGTNNKETQYIHRYVYEVVATKATTFSSGNPIASQIEVNATRVTVDFNDLSKTIQAATEFTVGVRVKTTVGYRSPIMVCKIIRIEPLQAAGFHPSWQTIINIILWTIAVTWVLMSNAYICMRIRNSRKINST